MNFLCSFRHQPSRSGNQFPLGQELALQLISVIRAARDQSTLNRCCKRLSSVAILSMAAFLFCFVFLLKSDVSLQYTVSVLGADMLQRAIFLSWFPNTIYWLNPRMFTLQALHKKEEPGRIQNKLSSENWKLCIYFP